MFGSIQKIINCRSSVKNKRSADQRLKENLHRKVVVEMNELERRVEREEQKEIIGMGGIGKEIIQMN